MRHIIRSIILSATLSLAVNGAKAAESMLPMHSPWAINAETTAEPTVNTSFEEVTIKAEGRKIHVNGAEDKTLEVYNIAGIRVASYVIDAPEKTITLTVPRGIYILRVDKVARKVNIL